jgi:DNA-binding NarL/FixJ family response regulator
MSPAERPRVLLADDYPGFVTALRRLLALDCEVVGSVADGSHLLEAAERLKPDVVVLDLNMPNMNGLEACRQLTEAVPQTKVIVLTAATDAAIAQRALAAGAFAFIAKQAVADDLLSIVKRACSH